jgi:hypothetical protein
MSNGVKTVVVVVGGLALVALLIFGGFVVGRLSLGVAAWPMWTDRASVIWGPGMMASYSPCVPELASSRGGRAGGFHGMMGFGARWRGFGGMMGAPGGMMGGLWSSGADPLTLDQAEAALDRYLANFAEDDLRVAEIMIFENHAYAEIVEASTGIGAREVLVDPLTMAVYPEPGPNMMWNTKYGHMTGQGGMMGGWGGPPASPDPTEMAVTPVEALAFAQAYLDRSGEGYRAADHADRFYGYYTVHIEQGDRTVGMLSVNGVTGDVFPHTWHGAFIEMSEIHAE